jgi:uncharacterized protein (DUF1778 family)
MASDADNSIQEFDPTARGTWPVIGTRVHPDERRLIDEAALEVGEKRGAFMLKAALDRAKAVKQARRAEDRRSA